MPSPWTPYLAHFEANARRPLPELVRSPDADHGVADIPAAARGPLARILARFQLGESGEGRLAHEIDRADLPEADETFKRALKLMVREEGRHGRILAGVVRALGGDLLRAKASNHCFRLGRRLLGVRFKLAVVVVAEVVGDAVYAALAQRLPAGPIRAALAELSGDERVHLDFHAAFMGVVTGSAPGPWCARARRAGLRVGLRLSVAAVGRAAVAVVLAENRHDLVALGIAPGPFGRDLLRRLDAAEARSFGHTAARVLAA